MANVLYDLGRESFLKGEISWSGDAIAISGLTTLIEHHPTRAVR